MAHFSGLLATSFLLVGCGLFGSADSGNELPSGTMRVISVTPLDGGLEPRENLFPAGEFQNWWAGAPAPEGFRLESGAKSSLARLSRSDGEGYRVKQTWTDNDDSRTLSKLLHTVPFDARANNLIELEVVAAVQGGQYAHIGLWMTDPTGNDYLLDPYFISLHPGSGVLKKYVRTFDLPDDGRFSFAVHGHAAKDSDDVEAAVVWYAWSLRSADSTTP